MIRGFNFYNFIFFILLALCNQVLNASEFLVSNPEPEDYKQLDITLNESSMQTAPYNFLSFPSLQFYYGIKKDLDIELLLTYAFYSPTDEGIVSANGIGDTFLSSTFCFLHESKYLPQLAIEPSYLIPTGSYNAGLGNGKPALSIPLSAQKQWKSLSFIMNVGYTYNWAPYTLNYFYEGVRLEYDANDKLSFGIELYNQGATAPESAASTASGSPASSGFLLAVGPYLLLNTGASYELTKHWSVQASAGRNINGSKVIISFLGINYHV